MSKECLFRGVYDNLKNVCTCSKGYTGRLCDSCDDGYVFNENMTVCTDSCASNSYYGRCKVCKNQICLSCDDSRILYNDLCYLNQCAENCKVCDISGYVPSYLFGLCRECYSGYTLFDNKCIPFACNYFCEQCDGNQCARCQKGKLLNGFCVYTDWQNAAIFIAGLVLLFLSCYFAHYFVVKQRALVKSYITRESQDNGKFTATEIRKL